MLFQEQVPSNDRSAATGAMATSNSDIRNIASSMARKGNIEESA